MANQYRSVGSLVGALALTVTSVVLAPPALATPDGCGETTYGQLCVRGPWPKTATYQVSYTRGRKSGQITVKLGVQLKLIKPPRDILRSQWFGTRKTRNGHAKLSGKVSVNDEVCVRARMVNQGITFVSQWYPDGKCTG
ncbi:hypothetical protein ACFU5N_10460 [Streptomyces albidoflavus]